MQEWLIRLLDTIGLGGHALAYLVSALLVIVAISVAIHLVLHRVVFGLLSRQRGDPSQPERLWHRALVSHKLFPRLAFALQGVILNIQTRVWLSDDAFLRPMLDVATQLWVLVFMLLSLFSLLNAIEQWGMQTPAGRRFPLRGILQSIKLIAVALMLIFSVALLIGKSPVIIFSGLGAMTAVTMLVFKDPILGLVAGIQLSANNMLSVGDWLEMPKYGADGDVIDISLTTVKVRNWDRTITTVPSYALISDSFKNWRGMVESGGRRIKRPINIDATSVHFLDEQDIERLRKTQLLSDYIEEKIKEIDEDNKANQVSPDSPANGRRLTNLGTFRAYLNAYLKSHKKLHKGLTMMVRQLEPGPNGIPLEVYAFTADIAWVNYESIQADIFDHIFAVVPEFGLRIHQTPTGYDLQQIGQRRPAVTQADQSR